MKKFIFFFILLLLAGLVYILYSFLPVRIGNKTIEISYGTPVPEIIDLLYEEGIIRSKLSLIILHIINREKISAGEYEFSGIVSPFDVYEKLSKGIQKLHKVTIPEGSDLYAIAKILDKAGVCGEEEFLKFATSESVARRFGLDTPTMEGFLFPDTYFFRKNTHPLVVIETMHRNFLDKTSSLRKKLAQKKLSLREWVTIASMIEKETAWEDEKPLVAAVIYNRLKKGMKLQIDPTVIYSLKRRGLWKGVLTRKELSIDDPYNTYVYYGLPPAPICNPGLSSLRFALEPAQVDYLYFVADPETKRHIFSSSYTQHVRNVLRVRR